MAAKVDDSAKAALEAAGGAPIKPEAVTRPEDVPEEFWDADNGVVKTADLLKAVAASKKAPEADPKVAVVETPEEAAAKAAAASAGLDMGTLESEYAEKGALSPDSIAKLEKAGIPKAMVDSYIAGQEALQQAFLSKGHTVAGGKESFDQMTAWAAKAYSLAEIEVFNASTTAGSEAEMTQAIAGLKSRFESAYGKQPGLLGGNPAGVSGNGYASRAEMVAEMRDPRYEKDSAYRAKVSTKIAATTAF
jgi:hypothetical protein